MQARRVYIENFRGIRRCEWFLPSRFVVLIGPGGSTKTTLLDAIGLALSRSYRPQFSDADFYKADTSQPILIEVAVTELPPALSEERTFGFDRSGIDASGTMHHDPIDGCEPCLVVRLTVDATLEPSWRVVRPDDDDEGQPIGARQRQRLGFFRLGDSVDLHLRWGTASALSSMTEARADAASVVVDAQRVARAGVFEAIPSSLQEVADSVQVRSRALGAAPYTRLRPGLDPADSRGTHGLVLHDESVPLTTEGLGTRRLTGLSIQEAAVEGGSIIAVDEIEYGLEPHRLVHVLQYLRDRASSGQLQVILTTHSPVAVAAIRADDLAVVASTAGTTKVTRVSPDLDQVQRTLRSAPVALLARRVIVAEGAPEVGLVRGLCRTWDEELKVPGARTSVTSGLAVVNARGGDAALKKAIVFRQLGYECAALVDNDDRNVDKAVTDAQKAGVAVIRWEPGRALEDEIVAALDEDGLRDFVSLAIEVRGEESVRATVANQLGVEAHVIEGTDPVQWVNEDRDFGAVARAIAAASKGAKIPKDGEQPGIDEKRAWFKSEGSGEDLATLILAHRKKMKNTGLARHLLEIKTYVYGALPEKPPERS